MGNLKNIFAYCPSLALMMVYASLPFGFSTFQRWALILFGVSFSLDYIIFSRWKGWKWESYKVLYVTCILFFLFIPLWHIWENGHDTNYYIRCIEQRVPFAAYGLIGLMGLSDKYKIRDFAVVSMLTSIFLVFFSYYQFYHGIGDRFYAEELGFSENLNAFRDWTTLRVNAHMTFNMFMNLTLLFIFYLWRAEGVEKWRVRLSYVSLFFILFTVCFLLNGRTGLITLLLFFVVYFAVTRYQILLKYKGYVTGVVLAIALSAYCLMPQFNKNQDEKNPRLAIWKVTSELICERPFLGYGVVEARETFVERGLNDKEFYDNYAVKYIMEHPIMNKKGEVDLTQMHPHNMFLCIALEFGFLGVVLLCFCLVLPIFFFRRRRCFCFLGMAVSAYLIQGLFESIGPHLLPTFLMIEYLLWNYAVDADELV